MDTTSDLPFFVYRTHLEADEAIQSLHRAGFDVKKLSVIGKGYHSEEHALGFYTAGDRIRTWGATGAFWGGVWGLLLAPAVFFLPGLGLVAMAGPVVAALVVAVASPPPPPDPSVEVPPVEPAAQPAAPTAASERSESDRPSKFMGAISGRGHPREMRRGTGVAALPARRRS